MRTNVIITDDFYTNPLEVRQFALGQEFKVRGNYPGARTVAGGKAKTWYLVLSTSAVAKVVRSVVIGIISSSNEPEEQAKAVQAGAQFWIIKSDDIDFCSPTPTVTPTRTPGGSPVPTQTMTPTRTVTPAGTTSALGRMVLPCTPGVYVPSTASLDGRTITLGKACILASISWNLVNLCILVGSQCFTWGVASIMLYIL